MKIIKQGAEAILYVDNIESQKVLIKERVKKNYRILQIDEKIRKARMKQEIKLLTECRGFGIPTPRIISVDEENKKIIMEYIDGEIIKDFFDKATKNQISKISFEIGKVIGKLHLHDIVHGDLTTSNMILKDGKIYFIDFGMGKFSKRIEDKGEDLKLLREALSSTHFKILKPVWGKIIKGYEKEYNESREVLEKVKEIEKRARYIEDR